MDKTSLVKVFLHDRGQDVESAWCQPVSEENGTGLFRLVNVPFLHAKPTFGDVIPAVRAEDGSWQWDRDGAVDARVGQRLHSDGGRYALIVDYVMRTDGDFGALVQALEKQHDIVAEGCFGPRGEEPGRLYLAAPRAMSPAVVMAVVTTVGRSFRFVLVHPEAPRAKKRTTKTKTRAGASKSKRAAARAKPAAKKTKAAKTKAAGQARPAKQTKLAAKAPSRIKGGKKPPSRVNGGKKPPSRVKGGKKPPSRVKGGKKPPSKPKGRAPARR